MSENNESRVMHFLEENDRIRIALGIEYNGSRFNGYQFQKHGTRTVQEELEKALSKVANEPIQLTCAGRTDAGVHATGQVVHFDTTAKRELKAWVLGGNSNSPRGVRRYGMISSHFCSLSNNNN